MDWITVMKIIRKTRNILSLMAYSMYGYFVPSIKVSGTLSLAPLHHSETARWGFREEWQVDDQRRVQYISESSHGFDSVNRRT